MLDGEEIENLEPRTCQQCGRTLLDYEVRVSGLCLDCDANACDREYLERLASLAQERWEHEQQKRLQAWDERWEEAREHPQPPGTIYGWLKKLAEEGAMKPMPPGTDDKTIQGIWKNWKNWRAPEVTPGTPVNPTTMPKPTDPGQWAEHIKHPDPMTVLGDQKIIARLEFIKWRISQGALDDDLHAAEPETRE